MLTIGLLKELIKDAPNDAIFSSMRFGNNNVMDFFVIKRALLVEGSRNTFFVLNQMGTHWGEKWEKGEYKFIKTIEK